MSGMSDKFAQHPLHALFWAHVEKVTALGDMPHRAKPIACFAIRDHYETGVVMAMVSGCNHRLPKRKVKWRLVHSPSLTVVTAGQSLDEFPHPNTRQAGPVSPDEMAWDYEASYLGEDANALVDGCPRVTFSPFALFLFPENTLVPVELQAFVTAIEQRPEIEAAAVITKDSLVLTDFVAEEVCIIVGERERVGRGG
jgi:hypothetical protein